MSAVTSVTYRCDACGQSTQPDHGMVEVSIDGRWTQHVCNDCKGQEFCIVLARLLAASFRSHAA